MKTLVVGFVSLLLMAKVAGAAEYEEFYVEAKTKEPVDPAVKVLREAAYTAARKADLAGFQALFAEKVAVYSASSDPDDIATDEFKLVKTIPRKDIFAHIAAKVVNVNKVSESQLRRSGFFEAARLLRDPDVGPNGRLNGMICNRPVNEPKPDEFKKALQATKSRIAAWVVAKQDMGPSGPASQPGQYPTEIFQDQMVLATKETHGDRRWTSIAALDGGGSLFYQNPQSYSIAPYFSRYVAEHVCFAKVNNQWKITALALREP